MFGFLKLIPPALFAGVVLAMAVAIFFLNLSLNSARTNLATARANLVTAVDVNKRNVKAIETIKLINSQCVDEREADETKHANAVAAWTVEKKLLEVAASEIQTREVEVYRTPICADLGKVDINAICPDLANSLRRRTAGSN